MFLLFCSIVCASVHWMSLHLLSHVQDSRYHQWQYWCSYTAHDGVTTSSTNGVTEYQWHWKGSMMSLMASLPWFRWLDWSISSAYHSAAVSGIQTTTLRRTYSSRVWVPHKRSKESYIASKLKRGNLASVYSIIDRTWATREIRPTTDNLTN